jgi:hypothetical protein
MQHSLTLVVALATLLAAPALAAGPAVGERAPDFALPGSDGSLHRLSDPCTGSPIMSASGVS